MIVWVVGSGAYEEWDVCGVAESLEAAVEGIKAQYGPPYVVRWKDPQERYGDWSLTGHFEGVRGYSSKHTASFDIRPYELWGEGG